MFKGIPCSNLLKFPSAKVTFPFIIDEVRTLSCLVGREKELLALTDQKRVHTTSGEKEIDMFTISSSGPESLGGDSGQNPGLNIRSNHICFFSVLNKKNNDQN